MQLENELMLQKGITHLKQRYYKGLIKGGNQLFKDEGIRGLYRGLFPSLLREGSYSTIRLGAYEQVKVLFGAHDPAHTPLWKKICSGALCGIVGSSIATPTDLVKVRMQAEGSPLKVGETTNYVHEGIKGLYTGVGPTVKRAAVLTATQIPCYDHTKHTLLNHELMKEGAPLHVVSSMVAGFITALSTSPIDVVKTRIMNQKSGQLKYGLTDNIPLFSLSTGTANKKYTSAFDCFYKTIAQEGPLGLYKGFNPNWLRIGPHTVIMFFIFEQLRVLIGMDPN
ncbi:hypothetical protein KUTeg_020779 [Tegillarca granosa]|uniref:Uncharacterized protein n=1 Tax=Tegillarca granosa TaxID=220873 RepID=A0ABQ9E908_TEGGR|nr:hypothetical protein KUTeg_020779 [Tegillarca granosa]